MSDINDCSPKELAALAAVVAIALSENKNANELNVLGNFITGVGCIILIIAAQQQSLESILQNNNINNNSKKNNKN
ncbi:hypothetical protein [Haloimpatiens massiliensis]|uniref:hypothetical protein n=1 Tax=Haloimpatiens massiliensis TaxID=1658110 RepID=UPI000C83B81D|nr:hypothetical protein [Haloimpatiens massiliensis]